MAIAAVNIIVITANTYLSSARKSFAENLSFDKLNIRHKLIRSLCRAFLRALCPVIFCDVLLRIFAHLICIERRCGLSVIRNNRYRVFKGLFKTAEINRCRNGCFPLRNRGNYAVLYPCNTFGFAGVGNILRTYVKNVMSNSVYYAAMFSGQPQSLKERLGNVVPLGAESTTLP